MRVDINSVQGRGGLALQTDPGMADPISSGVTRNSRAHAQISKYGPPSLAKDPGPPPHSIPSFHLLIFVWFCPSLPSLSSIATLSLQTGLDKQAHLASTRQPGGPSLTL